MIAGARPVQWSAIGGLALATLVAMAALAAPVVAAPAAGAEVAVLRGLDKITARVTIIDAPVGQSVRFGSLSIVVRACHKSPPEDPPEVEAFLEIDDTKPDEPPVRQFVGWMFASSPALSALQHPVYDVWVVDCKPAGKAASTDGGGQSKGAQ